MSDDRQLRDELEKAQSEVARLRAALARPDVLHADIRARIEQLTRNREQQQLKLELAEAEVDEVQREVNAAHAQNMVLQSELDQVLEAEKGLVEATVHRLNPGAHPRAGCAASAVLLIAIAVLLGVGW